MSLELQIKQLARTIAADQVAQDIKNLETFARKDEVVVGGADAVQLLEQLIAFYNGYKGTALDYRDYLDQAGAPSLEALYALGRGYLGVSA